MGDTPHAHPRLTSSRYTFRALQLATRRHYCGARSRKSLAAPLLRAAGTASLGVTKSFRNMLSLLPNGSARRRPRSASGGKALTASTDIPVSQRC